MEAGVSQIRLFQRQGQEKASKWASKSERLGPISVWSGQELGERTQQSQNRRLGGPPETSIARSYSQSYSLNQHGYCRKRDAG